ncbi:protein MpHD2 [Marchantia polymorpha subsp. ruderalis]
MGRAPGSGGAPAFRFTAREVSEMEKALDANKGSTPARSVVQHLSDSFSASADRAGQKPIQWKQVWNWFQNRRHSQKAKIARSPDKVKAVTAAAPEPSHPKRVATTSAAVPSAAAGRRGNDAQMEFEAKSARDGAWYDVSTFISHRLATTGDPEVRVRFAGFGSEEDEWVNVRTAVRQRSLPCEASECVAVLPGDLILCFQEGNEQALYYDADILDVQRRRHDVRGCRCRFWVRYRHDQAEEVVPLRKVCRRPETEYRLLKLQSYGKNPSAEATQNAAPKAEDTPGAAGNDVAGTGPANSSEAVAQASATPTPASTTSAQAAIGTEAVPSSSAPEIDPPSDAATLSAGPAEMVVTSSSVPIVPEQILPTVPPQVVEETKGAVEKSGQQVVEISAPSMQAESEMYDQSESIVVLDRVDLEGSRSNV